MNAVSGRVRKTLPEFNGQDMSNIVWAFAKLEMREEVVLMKVASGHVRDALEECDRNDFDGAILQLRTLCNPEIEQTIMALPSYVAGAPTSSLFDVTQTMSTKRDAPDAHGVLSIDGDHSSAENDKDYDRNFSTDVGSALGVEHHRVCVDHKDAGSVQVQRAICVF